MNTPNHIRTDYENTLRDLRSGLIEAAWVKAIAARDQRAVLAAIETFYAADAVDPLDSSTPVPYRLTAAGLAAMTERAAVDEALAEDDGYNVYADEDDGYNIDDEDDFDDGVYTNEYDGYDIDDEDDFDNGHPAFIDNTTNTISGRTVLEDIPF
jgi:hypothetical protein